ncbi:hypothetical protein RSOLAG22IIIB_04084 [Rhizoctonia solani]|uniref:HMG box domain-containing protein n=1 Tax=Rhizoctonia solani TaxID=456999 RepID=A0A0K6FU83_9AGAM|nr:hypothetical protein RSOLAG22IIIB_04084 [Rhizoctonia solani]
MFSNRILLMRPGLYAPSCQIRAFSLAHLALAPPRKLPPPPPPPPAKGRKAAPVAVKVVVKTPAKKPAAAATTRKAAPVVAAPAPVARTRLTEKERAARDKAREKEKAEKAKEKEREIRAKAKEKEKEKAANAKEREKLARAKEREKERAQLRKTKEREKERERKEKQKLREAAKKEKEKAKLAAAKIMEKPYPPPPKGPKSGYLMFATDPSVKREKGEGVVDDATKASEAWKALSDAEREVYNKKAEKARAAWKEEVAKWVSTLNLAQLEAARANREPGTRDESAMSTLPKRPGNPYALFLADMTSRQDFRNKVDALVKKEGITDEREVAKKKIILFGRTSADIWKSMSDKEKAVYTTKYEEAKQKWDKDFGDLIATQKEEIAATLP